MKKRIINLFVPALTLSLLMLFVIQTTFASEVDLCEEKYNADDFQKALPSCLKAAEEGDEISQFRLAYIYAEVRSVKHNDAEAVKWYRKSAEQGLSVAQNNLGWMYEKGRGVTQNDEEAVKWYRKSVEQGEVFAIGNLGRMYEAGRGVTQNYEKAVEWYRKAAEQGDLESQFNLARLYVKGQGVQQDYTTAVKLFRKVERGDGADVQSSLSDFMGEQSSLAQGGDSNAQLFLGMYMLSDNKSSSAMKQGVSWLKNASDQNNTEAQFQLSRAYELEKTDFKDPVKAFKWNKQAEINGVKKAKKHAYEVQRNADMFALDQDVNMQLRIARVYLDEMSDAESKALFWLNQAKNKKSADASRLMKVMFFPEKLTYSDGLRSCLGIVYQLMNHGQNDVAIARYASCSQTVNQGDETSYLQFGEHLLYWVLKGSPHRMTNEYAAIDNKAAWKYGVFDEDIVTSQIVLMDSEVVKEILISLDRAKKLLKIQTGWMRQIYKNMSSDDVQRIFEYQSRLDQHKQSLKENYGDMVNSVIMAPILARTEQLLDKAKPVFFGSSDEALMDQAAVMFARLNKKLIMSANAKTKNLARRVVRTFKAQAGKAKIDDLEVVQVMNGSDLDKQGADRWFDE